MPLELERKLKKRASTLQLKGDRADAYVYGTLRKTGWAPPQEKVAKQMIDRLRKR